MGDRSELGMISCEAVVWHPPLLEGRLGKDGVLPDVAVDASRIHSTGLQP